MFPGVDIVYLPGALRKKRSDHSRYREIVFHPSELSVIDSSSVPEITVHLLWAMKEAVYKSFVRNEASSFRFIPHCVEIISFCEEGHLFMAEGKIKNVQISVQAEVFPDYILALVPGNNCEIIPVSISGKGEARKFLSGRADELRNSFGDDLLFSYSHDGPYAAISYCRSSSR